MRWFTVVFQGCHLLPVQLTPAIDIGNSLQVSNRRSDAAGHDSRIAGLGLAMLLEVEELKVRSIPRVGRTARGEATRKQAGNHDTRGRTSSSFRAEEGDVSGTHDVS